MYPCNRLGRRTGGPGVAHLSGRCYDSDEDILRIPKLSLVDLESVKARTIIDGYQAYTALYDSVRHSDCL